MSAGQQTGNALANAKLEEDRDLGLAETEYAATMDGHELTIGAAILAGVIARAWGTWDARQRSASPPPPVTGTHWTAPARHIAAPWWILAAGGLALYSIAYAVAYLLGR